MESSYQQLSNTQQIVLNVLPIPSAIISILGSTAIIYLARERVKSSKRSNPYTRLLVAMSTCDILFSYTIAIATFLRPQETSFRLWAFGSDASCSVVAFMNQLSTAGGIWYSGMLSFYFLLTARYGMKNQTISKCIEPLMHFFAVGNAVATAVAGLLLGLYGEKAGVMACWTSRYNNESVYDLVGLLFFAVPVMVVFICLLINNIKIYRFVRHHTRELSSQELSDVSTASSKSLDLFDISGSTEPLSFSEQEFSERSLKPPKRKHQTGRKKKPRKMLRSQSQRLRLVFSQSILFVLSFLVCHFWNFAMGILQGNAKDQAEDAELLVRHYHWAVLQAAFLPMQGFFNMIIYVRPKYMILRLEFPKEGRLWTVKRIFLGDMLLPTLPKGGDSSVNQQPERDNEDENKVVRDTTDPIETVTSNRVAAAWSLH